jgi:hypothetical protein
MAMEKKSGKNKEVGKRPSMGTREDSFGGAPGTVEVAGGTMHTFGHKITDGVWPASPTSTDSKTGYPKDYQKSTKAPK